MIFCIITHVQHSYKNGKYFGYAPYINEMNIWIKYVDKVVIVAPLKKYDISVIHNYYNHSNIVFIPIPNISLINIKSIFNTILKIPSLLYSIFKAMKMSNHIHLRCPGNIGLLGCIVQILFPKKVKTAKYAGNWKANSKQPISYKLQKWILSSTVLSKNSKVLVYGEWLNQSKNIVPFFTATYSNLDKSPVLDKSLNSIIKFIFVGTLSIGKRTLYAIKIVENLKKLGLNVELYIYGNGIEYNNLLEYIISNNLNNYIKLEGNSTKDGLIEVYKTSHFLILPSKSEGWPKVVAEAMFWKCLPLSTDISCVKNMLDNENRGLILNLDLKSDIIKIHNLILDIEKYNLKSNNAYNWSQSFTTDKLEAEIKKLLN